MCGICGIISSKPDAETPLIHQMLGPLERRGPDAAGIFVQGKLGFGHRRLSILDLASTSQQPMVDPELGLGIVFNGCIYNFRELRTELQAKGYRFFSDGDTEVILKAYHAWGKTCVQRFKGMFAFALWERDSGRVMLARDRLGIKPLYYAEGPGFFRFASSLPALLAGGDIDTSLDRTALHHFFSFHAAVPAPRTILNGVKKLAPATLLTIEPDGTQHREQYWRFSVGEQRPTDRAMTQDEWSDALLESMTAAVDRRRVA